jgi:hypothetical protein
MGAQDCCVVTVELESSEDVVVESSEELESSLDVVVESSVEVESSAEVESSVAVVPADELVVVEVTAACWLADEEAVVPSEPS